MYINIDKKQAVSALKKKIAETVQSENVCMRALQAIDTVKHHKEINKRVITAIRALGGYATYHGDYTQRIVLYFDHDKRIYSTGTPDSNGISVANYFANTQEDIYFKGGYAEMIEAIKLRLAGILETRVKCETEMANIDIIIDEARALHEAYEKIASRSYIIREVFGIK